jgi:hypothetical protein
MATKENAMGQEQIAVTKKGEKFAIVKGIADQYHLQSFEITAYMNDGKEYDTYDDAKTIALALAAQTGRSFVDPNGVVIT